MKTNWEDLAATSYHAALSAIKTEIERGDLAEALAGLTEMIATEYRSVRMGVKDELAKAMQYTIVCKYAPQGNIKGEWLGGLCRARGCIDSFCEDYGFVDRGFIEAEWEGALGRELTRSVPSLWFAQGS